LVGGRLERGSRAFLPGTVVVVGEKRHRPGELGGLLVLGPLLLRGYLCAEGSLRDLISEKALPGTFLLPDLVAIRPWRAKEADSDLRSRPEIHLASLMPAYGPEAPDRSPPPRQRRREIGVAAEREAARG
jgi:hypothetical protein